MEMDKGNGVSFTPRQSGTTRQGRLTRRIRSAARVCGHFLHFSPLIPSQG